MNKVNSTSKIVRTKKLMSTKYWFMQRMRMVVVKAMNI